MAMTASKMPSYVMLNEKLTKPTVFTALVIGESSSEVQCCLRVDNPVEVKLPDLLAEYKGAPDDVEHFKNVRGLKYIYLAHLVDKVHRNKSMLAVTQDENNPKQATPYSSVVVAGELGNVDSVPSKFSVDGHSISTSAKRVGNEGKKYNLTVDGKVVSFYEDFFAD
ncbi:hypothetical protein D7S89_20305 [Trinickia fusca]|uniref:Uncharacterized protein n=2 Tax=Trinickia fusca TaxID=2419777 RepID=A0A494X3A6_9BURK|nr:hypothetical protein D7S89_20305 [Trinickia fusca]